MYNMYNRTDSRKQYALIVISIIIGVAIGASISSGRVITVEDTDNVVLGAQETFTGMDADNLYYAISGDHFTDIGNIYDRCTSRKFSTYTLEVNKLDYNIRITSGVNALVYVLKENATDPNDFLILDQFQITMDKDGSISVLSNFNVIIMVFYLNIRTVTISGTLYHG